MKIGNPDIALVKDGVKVIRAAAAAAAVRKSGLRGAAAAYGIHHTSLYRFLKSDGYDFTRESTVHRA